MALRRSHGHHDRLRAAKVGHRLGVAEQTELQVEITLPVIAKHIGSIRATSDRGIGVSPAAF